MSWREVLQRALRGESTTPLRARHSSPHAFERFDSSRIGTGEGAQTFGHGLYFAENPATAEYYRSALARPEISIGGREPREFLNDFDDEWTRAAAQNLYDDLRRGGYTQSGLEQLQRAYRAQADAFPGMSENARRDVLDLWMQQGIVRNPGTHTYEVDLQLDPRRILQQHLPLADQSRLVQDALGEFDYMQTASDLATGLRRRQLDILEDSLADRNLPVDPPRVYDSEYTRTRNRLAQGARVRLADELNERGIQAQMYPDQNSRAAAADATHNLVLHPGNDDRIEILRRWGLLGTLGGGSAYEALGGQP